LNQTQQRALGWVVDFGAGIHLPAELRFYSNLEKETIDDLKQQGKAFAPQQHCKQSEAPALASPNVSSIALR
jgi:hypothetical protein